MADPQDQPDHEAHATPENAPGAGPTPPAQPAPAADQPPPPAPPADHAAGTPEAQKAAKKTPAKKPPAKAAKKAAKKAPAKKAPAKKAPAKKAPAKKVEPAVAEKVDSPLRPETNGQHASGAKEAAAQAKSAVDAVKNPLAGGIESPADRFPVPLAVVVAVSLLALLLVRQLRRRGD